MEARESERESKERTEKWNNRRALFRMSERTENDYIPFQHVLRACIAMCLYESVLRFNLNSHNLI